MKAFIYPTTVLIAFITIFFVLPSATASLNDVSQVVNISSADMTPSEIPIVWTWMEKNWATVALVVSETAALVPGRVNGILHSLVKVIHLLFKRN